MTQFRSLLLFCLLALLFGASFPAIKLGLEYAPPLLFAALRFDVAAILLLSYVVFVTDDWRPTTRGDVLYIGVGGLFLITLGNALLFVGQGGTTTAVSSVLFSLIPLLTALFAIAIYPEFKPTVYCISSLILGLIGIVIIANPDPANLFGSAALPKFLVTGAAASIALGSTIVYRIEHTISNEAAVAWSMALGAVLLHLLAATVTKEPLSAVTVTPTLVGAVLYLALFASAFAYLIYFHLLRELGPLEVNLNSYVVPVYTVVLSWVLLDELIDPQTVVGFLVIFAGFALLKRNDIREKFPRFGRTPSSTE
ncbi:MULTISPECIES: DMT family transporter [unclassified Haladaptatus]|uniref:DMT family transporter n=1 Tax=unclassified Haladaptatus TaxID=2622732 RepID=UPI0023E872B1|nr:MULTISPECIES: DMT family transporter [unclassified Haladaptatus]